VSGDKRWTVNAANNRIDHGNENGTCCSIWAEDHGDEGWADLTSTVTDAARLRSLAATFDSHLNRGQTYTGAQVAAMLRAGEG